MTIEDLQSICRKFKGVTEDIKWEDHLCFNVGGKMFLVTAPDASPITVSFKTSDEDFEELITRTGFTPAQYLARYKWVFVEDIKLVTKKEWETLIQTSYNLNAEKLLKKLKKEIGLLS